MLTRICKLDECCNFTRKDTNYFCSASCSSKYYASKRVVSKIIVICRQCNKKFHIIPSRIETAKFCCDRCRYKWQSDNRCGKNSQNWNGGDKLSKDKLYKSTRYKVLRTKILTRDNYKCRICSRRNQLITHHIYPTREFSELFFDDDSIVTVCSICHGKYGYIFGLIPIIIGL